MARPAPQKPLRTALIGLSASAVTSWASTAHLPNFLTATGRSKFTITALLNSSTEAAQEAIKTYDLSLATKPYGNPSDLAKDPEVDFVVCNTRVDKHYETTLASIKAGKDAYIEWPIGSDIAQARELVVASQESNARVAVGLQGRWAPPVLKLKEIVEQAGLGKILSSEVRAYGGTNHRGVLPVGLKYFAERKVGGNPITIGFGHAVIDFVQFVVGELIPGTVHTRFELQRPEIRIRDPKSGRIIETVRSDVPDLLSLDGLWPTASEYTADNATLLFQFRRGQPFPGTPSLEWRINFEDGEVRLVSPSGISLQAAAYDEPVTIQLHHFDTEKVENIEWDWNSLQKEVPIRARTVLSCLYAFADGVREGYGWVGIEDAARRAEQIEGWLKEGGW
ncbi:putative oxidoreductase [Mytilinidion resinicola]|uniref:Oxidoreductase n=1 Tax=Mytilinidion resinicola TaxID=574789 RepID=A0A6A6YBD6_9PEZI|nr:putative oxidoreductase [Mytilinidion resinicola]KAF2806146.1 putative oxidoreductase [Mytilinidion resinicola]